jgi:hypothetical protein
VAKATAAWNRTDTSGAGTSRHNHDMRRALTVGLPGLAALVLMFSAAVEIAFLASPAASYCPLHGGFLSLCFRPSDIAKTIVVLAVGLAVLSVISGVFAWRGRLAAAWKSSLPGLIGVVLVMAAAANQNTGYEGPLLDAPPADFWLSEFGTWVAFAGIVLLAVACCVQLVIRFSQRRQLAGELLPPGPPTPPA